MRAAAPLVKVRPYRTGRGSNGSYRLAQLLGRNTQLVAPVVHLVILMDVDSVPISIAGNTLVIRHVCLRNFEGSKVTGHRRPKISEPVPNACEGGSYDCECPNP